MSAGDQYNAYRNDVIDSYEKERTTEHRGMKLGDAYDDTTPGIFNNNILITRMELANGLTFKGSFTYTENGTPKTETNFINVLFDGYGNYSTDNTKPKAIRVWSGNDHWLLTKESACQYLYLIPVEKEVDQDTFFDILYWNGTYNDLKTAINNNTVLQQGHAYLYHDGSTSSSGSSTTVTEMTNQNRSLDQDDLLSIDTPVAPKGTSTPVETQQGKVNSYQMSWIDELTGGNNDLGDTNDGETITLNQVWENIEDVYLIKAPIHTHFALAPDDKRLPFYGGTYRIVYKDSTTQDIPTFSNLTYFYSMQEVRTCQMPTVTNPNTDFDWFSHEDEQYRHIPLVVVRPSNPDTRIRVLDSLDGGVITSIDVLPDIYYAELNSKKMCSFQVEDGFTVLEEPKKKELAFTDKVFDISGFVVSYIKRDTNGSTLVQYSADGGTLYIKNPDITDDEYSLGNEKMVISREVYAKREEDTEEKLVTTLSYPVSEATLVDVVACSGITVPGSSTDPTESEEKVTDEEGALAVAKAQKSLGANEEQNVESTSLFSLKYYHQNDVDFKFLRRLKEKIGSLIERKKEELRAKRDQIKEELKQKVRSAALQGLDSVVQRVKSKIGSVTLETLALGETVEVQTSTRRYMYSNHIVPPIPQGVQEAYKNNLGIIPWPLLLKAGKFILPFALRGIKTLIRKITKRAISRNAVNSGIKVHGYTEKGVPYIYEETSEWKDSPVNGVCADAVITGYDPDTSSTATTLPVKILSQGQAFNIVLHHPGAISQTIPEDARNKTIIGVRCKVPPITNQMGYGESIGSSATGTTGDVGQWVAVTSDNQDDSTNTILTIANGGIVCPVIKWSSNISKGTVEQEVQVTVNGLNRLKAIGYSVAPHLLAMNNGSEDGIFRGILSLYNRGRRFMENHPRLSELTKRGVSWTIGRLMKRADPLTKKDGAPVVTNALTIDDDTPLQEPDIISDTPNINTMAVETTSDSTVDDENYNNVEAILFDGNYPSRKDITLNNLENFFKDAKVCLLYEDDEEYTGSLGTGLSRTYLDDGEFVPPTNLARDLLEFGTSMINVRGMTFSLGINEADPTKINIFNYNKYKDVYSLVLVSKPQKSVYTFGDKRMDLTGATWNIVDKSGKVIIDGLTEENLIVEDLPQNIEECKLEVPSNEDDKTKMKVHFMGFTNDELRVTLLHPYIVALEEQSNLGTITKGTAFNVIAMKGFRAPKMFICTRVWPKSTEEDATWPTTIYDLMTRLKTVLVLRDSFMRRKTYEIGKDFGEAVFNKIYTVTGYDPNSSESIQQITINCMGHTIKKWISIESVGNTDEEEDLDATSGEILDAQVHTETPTEEWDGSNPDGTSFETATGSGVSLDEDTQNEIMRSCRRIIASIKGVSADSMLAENVMPTDSLITHGKTGIESVFSNEISSYYKQSTGLRHNGTYELNGFFKKLWKKIKKAAKWTYKKIIKPAAKFIGGAVKTVVQTAVSVVGGALGSLTGGSMGAEDGGEYTGEPTQAMYYKPAELLGSNGEFLLTPLVNSTNGLNTISGKVLPWRGCIIKPYYSSKDRKNKLTRVWGSLRRFAGSFAVRNASTIPGSSSVMTVRRMLKGADVYPAKLFTTTSQDILEADQSVFFDAIEMIGVNTYDEKTEMLTASSSLANMVFYGYSLCMSSADLVLGDTWPSLSEVEQMTTLYAQRTSDLKWVAIPCSHENITIENYSNTDDSNEQLVTIILKAGTISYTTYAIFYRNSSNLKIVQNTDQCFVWLFPHPYAAGGSYIAYMGERRHSGSDRTSETDYTDFNYKIADTVKLVAAENRKILSINDYEDGAESMHWDDANNVITGKFEITSLQQGSYHGYILYAFAYTTQGEYTEVKMYDEALDYYVSKDGVMYKYNSSLGGMMIVGYDTNTTSTTATIQKIVKIVEEFSE